MRCTKQDHPWNPRVIELLGNLPYPFILDSFSPQRVKSCLESSQLLWLCRFLVVWDRPFTSFKKYLLSCCFLPGSVPGAGNKNMERDGEPALMKFNALTGGGDTGKLFHFGNSCFLSLSLKFCCCLWFGTTFVLLSHSRLSLESFLLSHHPNQYLLSDGFPSVCPFWVALLSSNSEPIVSSYWVSKNI